MAIWEIPDAYKINYSPNGDDVDSFSKKVKYCLEEAFVSLKELNQKTAALSSAISEKNELPLEIKNLEDGQILVYREASKKFRNEANTPAGEGKSLILSVDGKILAEYNGSSAVNLDLREMVKQASISQDISHLTRLVENLYLTLKVAELDPGGYDGLHSETFYGALENLDLSRSSGELVDGKITVGDGSRLVTKPIYFTKPMTKAHLVVKHKNVEDTEIIAEISLCDADFVKGEVIGIGTGLEQTVYLSKTQNLSPHFTLYFNDENQTGNFSFDELTGEVTFLAPAGAIVSADYFYNWGAENFIEMESAGLYPDRRNPNRATTQFTYSGAGGKVATLQLTFKQNAGYAEKEIVSIGTGKYQGFKLLHQANANEISVTPSSVLWSYNEEQNVIVLNAPSGEEFSVSYWWKGKSFNVDSFACMFDE